MRSWWQQAFPRGADIVAFLLYKECLPANLTFWLHDNPCSVMCRSVYFVWELCRWEWIMCNCYAGGWVGIVKCRCSAGGQRWILCYAGEWVGGWQWIKEWVAWGVYGLHTLQGGASLLHTLQGWLQPAFNRLHQLHRTLTLHPSLPFPSQAPLPSPPPQFSLPHFYPPFHPPALQIVSIV